MMAAAAVLVIEAEVLSHRLDEFLAASDRMWPLLWETRALSKAMPVRVKLGTSEQLTNHVIEVFELSESLDLHETLSFPRIAGAWSAMRDCCTESDGQEALRATVGSFLRPSRASLVQNYLMGDFRKA